MRFSERLELSEKYEKWMQENKEAKDCPFNVITYLDELGYLTPPKRKEEKIVTPDLIDKKIQELNQLFQEKALAENKTPDQIFEETISRYIYKPGE